MAEDLETIEALTDAAAANPKEVDADNVKVVGQSLKDLIELEKYRANKAAASGNGIGVRFFNTRPPGAT